MGNRRIKKVANPENDADTVNRSTLNDFKQYTIKSLNNLKLSEDISKCTKFINHLTIY